MKICLLKYELLILWFLALIVLSSVTTAISAETKLTPGLSVRETYDDNIDFTQRNKIDDYITTITPSLDINRQGEKSRIGASASASVIRYSEEDRLDRTDQHYNLAADYILTPLFTINAKGSYIRDITTESELEETGLRYERTVERKASRFQPGLVWKISEADSLSLNSGYSEIRYDEPSYLGYDDYSDYDSYNGGLVWSHVISNKGSTFFINSGYAYTDYKKTSDKTANYSLYSGFNFLFGPKWSTNLWAGARRTISDYYQIMPDKTKKEWTERNWGSIGSISLVRSFEKGSVSAGLSRDIAFSGKYETVERTLASMNFNYRLTRRLNGALSGSWSSSKSESDYGNTDEDFYSFSSSLSYQILSRTTAMVSYSHSKSEDHYDNTRAGRNVVFLQITTYLERLL